MTYTLEAYTNDRWAEVENSIAYDDAVNRVAGDLLAADDLALVDAYKDAMGKSAWAGTREGLIWDALDLADALTDAEYAIERDRLPLMEDDRLLATCKRLMSGVKERYKANYCMPERTVTHWAAWREALADEMAETVLKGQIEQDRQETAGGDW